MASESKAAPIYNDDGDAMDIDRAARIQTVRAYCGQLGTPLAALPCGWRWVQISAKRKWVYATYRGRRTRILNTPAVEAWLAQLRAED